MNRFFSLIDRTVEIIIIVSFISMVIVGGMQVVCRYGLKNSLSWSEEFQKFMHIWIIFLAIPLAYKKNAHIGMKVIFDKLNPNAQYFMNLLFDVLWLGFGGVLVYYTTRIMSGIIKTAGDEN